jgi:hypothetical protein
MRSRPRLPAWSRPIVATSCPSRGSHSPQSPFYWATATSVVGRAVAPAASPCAVHNRQSPLAGVRCGARGGCGPGLLCSASMEETPGVRYAEAEQGFFAAPTPAPPALGTGPAGRRSWGRAGQGRGSHGLARDGRRGSPKLDPGPTRLFRYPSPVQAGLDNIGETAASERPRGDNFRESVRGLGNPGARASSVATLLGAVVVEVDDEGVGGWCGLAVDGEVGSVGEAG